MKKLLFLLPLLMFFSPVQASGCDHPIFTYNDCGGGSPGPQGPQGPQGIQGVQGIQGIAGSDGATGPQGPRGYTGHTGPQGEQGVAGTDGKDGKDGIDGKDGVAGPQGIAGVAGSDVLSLAAISEMERTIDDTASINLAFDSIQIHLPQKASHRVTMSMANDGVNQGVGIGYAYMFDDDNRTAVIAGWGHAQHQDVVKVGVSFEF